MYFPFFILHDWGKRSAEARSSHLSGVVLRLPHASGFREAFSNGEAQLGLASKTSRSPFQGKLRRQEKSMGAVCASREPYL